MFGFAPLGSGVIGASFAPASDPDCGPFTLEQLDMFGNLDTLAFSLDDIIWTLGDTCILYGNGDVSAAGTVDSSAIRNRVVAGNVSGVGTVASSSNVTRNAVGAISGVGTVSASATPIRTVVGSIFGIGTVVSSADRLVTSAGSITARARI